MNAKHILTALVVPLALAVSPADAALFTFDLSGAYTASFTIGSDLLKAPTTFENQYFEVDGTGIFGDDPTTETEIIAFNTAAFGGGMTVGSDFVALFGDQLFTGDIDAPTLRTGDFMLGLDGVSGERVSLRVTSAVAAVPEPATWTMMILGFGLIGAASRRKSPRVRVRFA